MHGPKRDSFQHETRGNMNAWRPPQQPGGDALFKILNEGGVLPPASLPEPNRSKLGLVLSAAIDELYAAAIAAHSDIEISNDGFELRRCVARRRSTEGCE